MADYKTMYFHLAGRVAGAVDSLEASNSALVAANEAVKASIQAASTALETSNAIVLATLQASTAALDGCITSLYALRESLKNAQQATEEMVIGSDEDIISDE